MQTNAQPTPLLDLDLLRTLVAIAETGNFTAAAEAVHRTPSAVSMQVKRVEEIIGRPVFKRDSRSVSATSDGELLLAHGRRVLALNAELIKRYVEPEVAGVVRLGVPDNLAENSVPGMLRQFSQTHCCVTVDVVVDESIRLKKRVRENELDLAVVACNIGNELDRDMELLFSEKLVWAGAKNGISYEQDPLPISVWEEGCSWRKLAIDSLEAMGRDYRIAFMSAFLSAQRAAVVADMAIAPIPKSSCNEDIVELGKAHGLPELEDYGLALVQAKKPTAPAIAAAQYFRNSFSL